MSKRPIESLDEDDRKVALTTKPKKERKSYSNCFHATKSGMRCLNTIKHGFKIGRECYDFCDRHFDATLLKLFTMLVNPIAIPQHQIRGMNNVIFDDFKDLQIWNLEDTELLAEIAINPLKLSIAGEMWHRPQKSMSELLPKMMEFLERHDGFIIKMSTLAHQKLDSGSFEDKVYGNFQGNLVEIPVDDIQMDVTSNMIFLTIKMEILYV